MCFGDHNGGEGGGIKRPKERCPKQIIDMKHFETPHGWSNKKFVRGEGGGEEGIEKSEK